MKERLGTTACEAVSCVGAGWGASLSGHLPPSLDGHLPPSHGRHVTAQRGVYQRHPGFCAQVTPGRRQRHVTQGGVRT